MRLLPTRAIIAFASDTNQSSPDSPLLPSFRGTGKNQVIGRSFSEMTRRAQVAVETQRAGGNAAGHPDLVESRPVGTQHLYAQVSSLGPPVEPTLGVPHTGKGIPLLDETKGVRDFRNSHRAVGTNGVGSMRTAPTASLAPTPYGNKIALTGREKGEKSKNDTLIATGEGGHLPGYTGHLHANQHLYGKSYGHSSRQLVREKQGDTGDECEKPSLRFSHSQPALGTTHYSRGTGSRAHLHTSGRLSSYKESYPQGQRHGNENLRAHIPGYTGHVPVKNVEMHGLSFGRATGLAPAVSLAIRGGTVGAAMSDLGELRPQGVGQRYAQALAPTTPGKPLGPYVSQPLTYQQSKGSVDAGSFKVKGRDNKWRAPLGDDALLVVEDKHLMPGCTLYTHGRNHVFGESVGKMTRRLRDGHKTNPTTSIELLHYGDARPQHGHGNVPERL
jgi:hypothetical protein